MSYPQKYVWPIDNGHDQGPIGPDTRREWDEKHKTEFDALFEFLRLNRIPCSITIEYPTLKVSE